MSRLKPSGVIAADGRLMSTVRTKYYPPQTSQQLDFSGLVQNCLRVPDITINPKSKDSYRAPSNYYGERVIVNRHGQTIDTNGAGFTIDLSGISHDAGALGPWDNSKIDYHGEGNGFGYVSVAKKEPSFSEIQAIRMKILNNIRDETFDVAMLLAEIGKTATTASGLLYRIGRSMAIFQKSKPKIFSYLWHGRTRDNRRPTDKFLRESAGAYLEWKYGIMPTVYDLQGMTEQLDANASGKSLFDNPPLLVARATNKVKGAANAVVHFTHPAVKTTAKVESTYSARADFSVEAEGLRGLNRYGLGLTSIATIAYDLTPFSFVFNMAVPMAELIKAWGALAGVTVRGYTETVHHKYETGSVPLIITRPNGVELKVNAPPVSFETFSRTGGTSIPMPLPFIRNPVSVGNISTVLSLFTTLRSKS